MLCWRPSARRRGRVTNAAREVIRVVLADGHPICVKGVQIELSVEDVAQVVACAFNSTELFNTLDSHECDVLVSDYVMSGADFGDGLSMFARIQERYPSLKLVVLTSIDNRIVLRALEDLGVRAIVSKGDLPEHLRRALCAACRGEPYRSPRIQAAMTSTMTESSSEGVSHLTRCEVEVVRLFLSGFSLGEIAEKFSRSKQTVSAQKRAAMRKLDVHNDIDLVRYGVRSGLAA
ncbi:response regulator transcription factor [Achromobacter seleniivolatilans]|uniref:Response regulator transcription factor n=1 Tax=Achromobacter seleniivolatilans TaxID=3047478 RepID=A0ABY9LZQ4_9BURK|nr:response regulator transcription factor [Achromobacter sp. R39]WMD20221.1 response regulator transcription factor [Achromobacter sp. R39]